MGRRRGHAAGSVVVMAHLPAPYQDRTEPNRTEPEGSESRARDEEKRLLQNAVIFSPLDVERLHSCDCFGMVCSLQTSLD